METGMKITKLLLLVVLLGLVARTVHAQASPCNPYTDSRCGDQGHQPGPSPYTPGPGPVGGLGPYGDPSNPSPYDPNVAALTPMVWTMNGDLHLNQERNRLGWLVMKNLDSHAQTALVVFTFEGRAPLRIPVPIPAMGRKDLSLHEVPELAHGYFSATVYFERRGHAYTTFAAACEVINGAAECADAHDVGSVLVP